MKVADTMIIPSHIGKINLSELAGLNISYVRNADNTELRDYATKKFGITDDRWHFEEGDTYLIVVRNDGV